MMGKIISIALVGLTQFGIWLLLTIGLVVVAGQFLGGSINPETMVNVEQMVMPLPYNKPVASSTSTISWL